MWSKPVLARCIFDCINIIAFTTAIVHMQMAELYALFLMSPFLMTILAVIWLGERVGYRRWLAILGGFCGALLVVRPDFSALSPWAGLGFLAALAAAFREIVTRRISAETPTLQVMLCSSLFAGIATLIAGFGEPWPQLTTTHVGLIALHAVAYLIGALLLVHSCRYVPLSIVAAFRYILLLWGGLFGYFVFGDIPGVWSLIGAALIVLCGLYTFHRETVRRRTIASASVTTN